MAALQRFHDSRGRPLRLPVRLHKERTASLYLLWRSVMAYGGYEPVCSSVIMNTPPHTGPEHTLGPLASHVGNNLMAQFVRTV